MEPAQLFQMFSVLVDVWRNYYHAKAIRNNSPVLKIAQVTNVSGKIINVGKNLNLHVQILMVLHLQHLFVKVYYKNVKEMILIQLVFQKFVQIIQILDH